MQSRKHDLVIIFSFSLILAILSLWRITEQDIFWQLRAGDEILRNFTIQTTDTWSFTAYGEQWLNIQWLSTVIMRAFFYLGSDSFNSMIILRSLLVFTIFSILGLILYKKVPNEMPKMYKNILVIIIMELSYLAIAFRLQMRSEIFVFIVYALLIYIWDSNLSEKFKKVSLIVSVILAANLHTGVAPFVIGLCFVLILNNANMNIKNKIIWIIFSCLGILVTPHTYKSLPILYKHIYYYSNNIMQNPDHQAFNIDTHLSVLDFSFAGWAFILISIIAFIGLIKSKQNIKNKIIVAMFAVFLILMSLNRIRTFPFAILFLSPLAVSYFNTKLISKLYLYLIGFAALALIIHLKFFNLYIGWGLDHSMYPIGSFNFIKQTKPLKNIYHGFAYGHYMDWNVQEYPVFVDTRETMFWKIQSQILAAYASPSATESVYKRYNINTSVNPIPATKYIGDQGFLDLIEIYNPSSQWALVYFDNISIVTIKRIPEHKHIYENHEYKLLKPNLPPGLYLMKGMRSEENDKIYETEINRCRKDEPENVFCRIAQSIWWRIKYKDDKLKLNESKNLLETVERKLIRRADLFQYNVELMEIYKLLGYNDEASRIEQKLGEGVIIKK